jgi:cytochrome b6-f complex iron-sulfur subunit
VRFTTKQAVGFISTTGTKLQAVSGACTHQGCLLALNQPAAKLDCPCHRASFARSGDVLNHELPAALAPLPRLSVRERDGQIEVLLPPDI